MSHTTLHKKLLSFLLFLPEKGQNKSSEVVRMVRNTHLILPFVFSLAIVGRLIAKDYVAVIAISASFISMLISYGFFRFGRVNTSVLIITTISILTIGVSATLGAGIHDPGILSIPAVVFFSGMLLDRRYIIGTAIATACTLVWLGMEQFGLFETKHVESVNFGDLISANVILIFGAFLSYGIISILNGSLKKVEVSSARLANVNKQLKDSIEQKKELMHEIHQQAKLSLCLVDKVFEQENDQFKNLTNISFILRSVHEVAIANNRYDELLLNNYFKFILTELAESCKLEAHLMIDPIMISIDQIGYAGIFAYEILMLNTANNLPMISSRMSNEVVSIIIEKIELNKQKVEDRKMLNIVMRQLKASIEIKEDECKMTFLKK